jgi:hypothetical protein
MSKLRFGIVALMFALMLVCTAGSAFAQAGGGGAGGAGGAGGGGRGNRGNRGGNFDPAAFRQQQMDRIKTQLGASDDEWKALEPKVEKVMTAQRDSRGGRFGGGRGGRGGNNANATPANETAIAKAAADLRTALDNKDTAADEIQKKLAAYREARDASRKALADAQKELKELLTARQEAVMVQMGMLE